MKLDDLTYVQNITPYWGRGHYLARTRAGELVEVLVAEPRSESVTSLLSWANMLERVVHPSIPRVKTIVHTDVQSFVVLSLREGVSLSECIHQRAKRPDLLGRIDVLSIFHQLASTLAALNSFGLNHGNLTLDQMKLVGEGRLQLHGWAPLSDPSSFKMRAAEELKSLQSFLYLSIVGEFPPRHHSLTDEEVEMLSPVEKRRLVAWQMWYHAESSEPSPNLSTSQLMLFNEPPRSAKEIVAELSPHVDLSLQTLYYDLHQELKRRDELESSYHKHERLLRELEHVQRQLQTWLNRQREQLREGEQQSSTVEQLYNQVSSLQAELERSGQQSLSRASQAQSEIAPHVSQSSTLLYDYATQDVKLEEMSVTFGDAVTQLKSRWENMELESPLMSALDSQGQSAQGHNQAEVMLTIDDRLENLNQAPSSLLSQLLEENRKRYAQLGSPPDMTSALGPDAQAEMNQTSQELPMRFELHSSHAQSQHSNSHEVNGSAPHPQRPHNHLVGSNSTDMVTRIPYQSEIVSQSSEEFTSHFDGVLEEEERRAEAPEPATAFSHRNFFFFLYFVTTVVFVWSIGRGSDVSPELSLVKTSARVSASISPQDLPKAAQSQEVLTAVKPERESLNARVRRSQVGLHEDQAAPLETSLETSLSQSMRAASLRTSGLSAASSADLQEDIDPPSRAVDTPQDMVLVDGGVTESELDERAQVRAVTYCVFEPHYKRSSRRSRERCKWLVSKDLQTSRSFEVKPFFMDIYEVSRRDYKRYCEEGGACQTKLEFAQDELDLPMVNVSMLEAMDYCRMHQKTLPTYAQWLFAARGDRQLVYPWGDSSVRKGNKLYRANYASSRSQVGSKLREIDGHIGAHAVRFNAELSLSPYGVAHLVGNVGEWVVKRKLRQGWVAGGGWRTPIWQLRTTFGTLQHKYAYRSDDVGFRCVRNLDEGP